MLQSTLRLALRTFRRRLGFTTVNALGLTIGLACCALVAVFLQYELSYDAHHADADRIYCILSDYRSSTYSTISFEGYNSAGPAEQRALATRLPEAVPAIEQATNVEILNNNPTYVETEDGRTFTSDRQLVTTTGPAFADLFTFERVAGAPLAWLAADWWLGQFAYQVSISPLVFLGTGLGALVAAVFAVSTQAVRAARVDPAAVLRSE